MPAVTLQVAVGDAAYGGAVEAVRLASFALFGLLMGSFLTVVVHRLPRNESVVAPRSSCPRCGTEVRARDNVPILSYLALRGRCHGCDTHISAEYPLTEAMTAALFVAASLVFRPVGVAAVVALFLGAMLAAALIDARHRIIPNRLTYPALVLAAVAIVALSLAGQPLSITGAVVGFLCFGGGLLLVAIVSPGGMGMGDVKLGALIGLVLGAVGLRYVAVAAGMAVLLGGVAALVALAAGRGRKGTIPFGPFLASGAAVAALAGAPLAGWYLGFAH
jgi:leader peptidase (prepilin peptidase)/N-methyltransferase